jgi:hypothetical protein
MKAILTAILAIKVISSPALAWESFPHFTPDIVEQGCGAKIVDKQDEEKVYATNDLTLDTNNHSTWLVAVNPNTAFYEIINRDDQFLVLGKPSGRVLIVLKLKPVDWGYE